MHDGGMRHQVSACKYSKTRVCSLLCLEYHRCVECRCQHRSRNCSRLVSGRHHKNIYVILSRHTRGLTTEANGGNVKNPSLTRGLDVSRIWQV